MRTPTGNLERQVDMAMTDMAKEMQNARWSRTLTKMAERTGGVQLSEEQARTQLRDASLRCEATCEVCAGTGYYRKNPGLETHERGYGEIEMCPRYRSRQLREMDLSPFGMERDELDLDWSMIKNRIGHLRLDAMKAAAVVKPRYERGWGMAALLGTYGQGKTLVGKILIAKALVAGKRAAYANMARILDDIRLAFDEKENMTRELLRRMEYWNSLDVLFIDELDRVNGTEWAAERMFQVLDQRYVRAVREEALTVVASNKADDDLDGYLVSRLKDRRFGKEAVVYLNGDDARQAVAEGWRH